MKGRLILENGMIFEGNCIGYIDDAIGEVVFNTGMTGYQEILTDPSYYGQIVVMTYPLIGNYGINFDDFQSNSIKVKGFVAREFCVKPNNWRNEIDINSYLKGEKIIGIEGIDTRFITKTIRSKGTMRGIITTQDIDIISAMSKIDTFCNTNAVADVTRGKIQKIKGTGKHLAVIDVGIKENIINSFVSRNCQLTIFPAFSTSEEILNVDPDAIFISNGPGDPKDLGTVVQCIKEIIGKKPVIGICLGHQLIALAEGADTEKMKFGHRGSNHPVKNLLNEKVTITSQNHGYVVKNNTMPDSLEVTHINMNDFTIEGFRNLSKKIMCVQFHPEASPGPYESNYIFDDFLKIV